MDRLRPGVKDDYLEWAIEEAFVEGLEDAGWITIKGDKIKRGFADRFCFGPRATTIIVELKKTGARKNRRGEKLQDHYRKEFERLGFTTTKCKGWNNACELLREMLELYGRRK